MVAKLRVFGKSTASIYLRVHKAIWQHLPSHVRNLYVVRCYGEWLHRLVCIRSSRQVYIGTFFLRNRPALELMRRLVDRKARGSTLAITVLGCSIGADVYSILWIIRSARPDLKVMLHAVDLSEETLNIAEKGVYTRQTVELVGAPIFERLTAHERREMFDWDGDRANVKSWLREGIIWCLDDAADPELIQRLGHQDVVVANNFLCHLAPAQAEKCLRNIARLIRLGGYLFVSGVDIDIRTKVALDLGWEPVTESLTEIHDGDDSVRADWPLQWWGLEPLNPRKRDWQTRYAAVFKLVAAKGKLP
jgi:SAM-dependent methyltransferase